MTAVSRLSPSAGAAVNGHLSKLLIWSVEDDEQVAIAAAIATSQHATSRPAALSSAAGRARHADREDPGEGREQSDDEHDRPHQEGGPDGGGLGRSAARSVGIECAISGAGPDVRQERTALVTRSWARWKVHDQRRDW